MTERGVSFDEAAAEVRSRCAFTTHTPVAAGHDEFVAPLIEACFGEGYWQQLGLSHDQIRSIASEQSLRLAAGEPPRPCGPAVGERERAPHILLDRVAGFLLFSALGAMRGGDPTEMLALARLACDVPDVIDDAPVFAAIRGLLDVFDDYAAEHPNERRRLIFLILAATVAKTPDVPVPAARVKSAPPSVERHTPLSVPVAQCAHTTGVWGASRTQGRPGDGAGCAVKPLTSARREVGASPMRERTYWFFRACSSGRCLPM